MSSLAFLAPQKRSVVLGAAVFVALFAYLAFPSDGRLSSGIQSFILGIAFFAIIPIAVTRFVVKEPLEAIGFAAGPGVRGWLMAAGVVITGVAAIVAAAHTTPLGKAYEIPSFLSESFLSFVAYETLVVGVVALLYEVFFRGFVQLLWLRRLGSLAVLLQAVLFVAFLYLGEVGMTWQIFPLVFGAVLSGIVAAITRSIWYSWVATWVFLVLSDAYLLTVR